MGIRDEKKLHVLAGVLGLVGVAFAPQCSAYLVRTGAVEAARLILGPHPLQAAVLVLVVLYLAGERRGR